MAKAQPSPQEGLGLRERSCPVGMGLKTGHLQSVFYTLFVCFFPHPTELSKSFPGLHNKASSLSSAVSSAHRGAKGAQLYHVPYRVPAETEQQG